jgi:magnesium-transporting ATPase (P-type)
MSTISVSHEDSKFTAYVKGSPEMIETLSIPESIPKTYYDVLEKYTEDGLRVLALGYKDLPKVDSNWIESCKREEIELDLTFIGFLIMENKVKDETNPCIEELQKANIDTIMATGDNGLTGVAVGRKCGIIDANRTVYLAERVKDKDDKFSIKWI